VIQTETEPGDENEAHRVREKWTADEAPYGTWNETRFGCASEWMLIQTMTREMWCLLLVACQTMIAMKLVAALLSTETTTAASRC
jgi:hypothetical protein